MSASVGRIKPTLVGSRWGASAVDCWWLVLIPLGESIRSGFAANPQWWRQILAGTSPQIKNLSIDAAWLWGNGGCLLRVLGGWFATRSVLAESQTPR